MANLRRNRFHIGERIGEADRAAGNWNRDVKKWNADGGAAALSLPILPASAATNSLRWRSFSMRVRIDFGISQNLAGGIDDGDASAGGLTFLRGDVGEGVAAAVDFDAMGQELSLLNEIALDFAAQRSLPRAAEHESNITAAATMTTRKTGHAA